MQDVLSIRHMYYQWVSYYLFFLTLLFYSGHFIWKALEKKRLAKIIAGMETLKYCLLEKSVKVQDKTIPSFDEKQKKIDYVAKILWTRIKHDLNNDWTMKLILVEVWSLVLVLFVFWLTDVFLGGKGAFASMTIDSAFKTFPTETSCIFFKYGPSGTIQRHDALCILATNIVNVYIFFFFYVWMLILICVSSLAIIWRLVGFFFFRQDWFNRIIPFNHINSLVSEDARITVFKTLSYFDWVFLNYVSENTSASVYKQVFQSLADLIKDDYGEVPDEESKPLTREHD
jgi:innexin